MIERDTIADLILRGGDTSLSDEAARSSPQAEFQDMRTLMLEDLPADPAALRDRIKSVQVHRDRGVVTFETKANSWFVQLDRAEGSWKVSGF